MGTTYYIKNMVCPRCIMAVENIFSEMGLEPDKIELGEVTLKKVLAETEKSKLNDKLQQIGFELLDSTKTKLIAQLKKLIIEQIHYSQEPLKQKFSVFLSEKLNHDYTYLSRLFSSIEGITIEKFIAKQRIEKVKELLFYNEMTLSEIAFAMDYSSVAYLSAQFKKETGMTTSAFKAQKSSGRKSLDGLGAKS